MKKLHYLIFLFIISTKVFGQSEFRPWKVEVGVLFGELTFYNSGILAPSIEPKYNLTDNLTIGLRGEYILFANEDLPDPNNPHFGNFKSDGSILSLAPMAEWNFTKYKIRPYLGLGGGYFLLQSSHVNDFINLQENLPTGGLVCRGGLSFGHVRVSGEYNYIFSDAVNFNYFSLKLGYEIGGGKKLFW